MPRPKNIQELAGIATTNTYDASRPLKDQIRAADNLRKEGKEAHRRGDLESAFVCTARAVTLILERIPRHSQYNNLTSTQKQYLAQNGNDLLQLLEQLKLNVCDKYDAWLASGGREDATDSDEGSDDDSGEDSEVERRRQEHTRRERRRAEEDEQRRRDEDMYRRRDAEERERLYREQQAQQQRDLDMRRLAKEAKQRQAEEYSRASRKRDDEIRAQRRFKEDQTFALVNAAAGAAVEYASSPPAASWDRGREMGPRPMPGSSSSSIPITYPNVPHVDSLAYVTPPKRDDLDFSSPGLLPLESPNRLPYAENGASNSGEPRRRPSYPPPMTTTSPNLSGGETIEYPRLMTQHQLQQGYRPSTASIFVPHTDYQVPSGYPSPLPPPMQAGISPPHYANPGAGYPSLPHPSTSPNSYYEPPTVASALQRAPSIPSIPYIPAGLRPAFESRASSSSTRSPMPEPAPPRPPKVPVSPPERAYSYDSYQQSPPPRVQPSRQRDRSRTPSVTRTAPVEEEAAPAGLRTIWLPGETLHKFIQIAAINTERKRETCGLLLGRQKRNSFTVHTLLVPRQTSDENSCTMTHEEMIMEFQEKRDLLTLGWIHTHPTQSCFMSSLDLHTHSGFQAMLPEAFAIVCAPRSTPSFGVFRLTDPPGLQIIKSCTNKNAFHPHPDQPIYTDADSGHVRMVDIPLEIADLRVDIY